MLFNTVIKNNTSTCMIHNISTSTSCLLLLLPLLMINSTLSIVANVNAHIISPGTTIRTVVITITITVVVIITTITMIAIKTIIIIITNTRLLLLLLLAVLKNFSVSAHRIITTITTSIISNICVNSSDRTNATTIITVVMVGISILLLTTNYCCSHYY